VDKDLRLKFHGKILDQLGFQTYQSPVASLSEMVANAWDADAKRVNIELPENNESAAMITIEDDGNGMTFDECQNGYLNVGYDCRKGNPLAKTLGGRSIMGRKGIGKFAGFGICKKILIDTTSAETGENTSFVMDIEKLRTDEYVEQGGEIKASTTGPNESQKERHGTRVALMELTLSRLISKTWFPQSLSRRFLVHQTSADFQICVDSKEIPKTENVSSVEFAFPKDYPHDSRPDGLTVTEDGWGMESLPNGKRIKWRIFFNKDTIHDEELQGITILANGKLVQRPFFFNLSGGLGGQAGQSYMFGQVIADYVDQLWIDPISAERQRVNWELEDTAPLLEWGQKRVKELLTKWHDARGEKKRKMLEEKIGGFKGRLDSLGNHERKNVTKVLQKLGAVSTMSQKQYEGIADSVLTSWEGGRLKGMWQSIAESEEFSESELLELLLETNVISALNVAEAVKTKLEAISKLKDLIDCGKLENAVRDHLAQNPWIISPKWDTFKKETRASNMIDSASKKAQLQNHFQGRVDLALSSGNQLLVLEFMRPGLTLDWDHISRCKRYINYIKEAMKSQTGSDFQQVSGYVIADNISSDDAVRHEILAMARDGIVVSEWKTLLSDAKSSWQEYLEILAVRGNGDSRLKNLLEK